MTVGLFFSDAYTAIRDIWHRVFDYFIRLLRCGDAWLESASTVTPSWDGRVMGRRCGQP